MDNEKSEIVEFDVNEFKVSFDDFIRFLDGVPVNSVCVHCEADGEWSLDTGNDEKSDDDLTIYRRPYAEGALFRPYFVMSCGNCGFVRQVNATTVIDWLEENKEV
ncbi:hypothetical protein [Pseudomonas moraviensis]|uniref:hypothetical protein n=1 Tax=Pseudomonas moraviensis TaxID=321662 RepID=UPI000F794EA2|nr:hypothetical protein [Pseudomonas moraviensis]RRW54389.1 hypothetical protein EGJ55_16285 [Pseudomonas moraviensis]